MTEFPSADDYVRAVQDPRSFVVDELRDSKFPVHPLLGVPMPASGSSAVVFKAVVGGEEQALRFFTRSEVSTKGRYVALNGHFESRGIASHMATSTWLDDAISVNGKTWPAVRMQWVNGRTLDQYIDNLVDEGDTDTLSGLVPAWRGMVRSLQAAEFAHGDLQHGNVLVDDSGHLRLVDFDCSWLDGFDSAHAPSESGHRNYQRTDTSWGRWMDTFPGLVVHTSLLALAKKPSLWEEMHNGENLIFESKDFVPPYDGRVWREIEGLQDQQLINAATRLRQCCDPTWSAGGGLESLLEKQWWEQAKGPGGAEQKVAPLVVPALALPKQKSLRDRAGAPPAVPQVPMPKAVAADQSRLNLRSPGAGPLKKSGAQQGAAWWGSAGAPPVTPTHPSAPAAASWQPASRRSWSKYEKLAFALAVIALVGVAAFIVYLQTADKSSSAVPASSSYSVREKFSLSSLSTEVGSCNAPTSSNPQLTYYDVEELFCNGASTPYYFEFYKYSGVSPETWVEAAKVRYSLARYEGGSCYDTYTATQSGRSYVFFVYNKSPFVGVVYAGAGSNSTESIASRSFQSISSGC